MSRAPTTESKASLSRALAAGQKARAIAMWDFSWLERRWPNAGYEDWDEALDGLLERGYDAVRIDAYPHLLAVDPEKEWSLEVLWTVQDWGSPAPTRVQVWPNLATFLQACAVRGIRVGLSSWFRQDAEDVRRRLKTPSDMARIWIRALELLRGEGLLDTLLFVDLCNEWPGSYWAPFFVNEPSDLTWGGWHTARSMAWMRESISTVRAAFPNLPLTYSFNPQNPQAATHDLGFLDFFEPHIWMVNGNDFDFLKALPHESSLASPAYYYGVQKCAESTYRARPEYWQNVLKNMIGDYADVSRRHNRPLVTTECWAIVDYKDWPLLDWGWVKELCAWGVETAVSTGRWRAIATSNFCGPQFRGMWRDLAWHQNLTRKIHKMADEKPVGAIRGICL